jgi:hypothetical protein
LMATVGQDLGHRRYQALLLMWLIRNPYKILW